MRWMCARIHLLRAPSLANSAPLCEHPLRYIRNRKRKRIIFDLQRSREAKALCQKNKSLPKSLLERLCTIRICYLALITKKTKKKRYWGEKPAVRDGKLNSSVLFNANDSWERVSFISIVFFFLFDFLLPKRASRLKSLDRLTWWRMHTGESSYSLFYRCIALSPYIKNQGKVYRSYIRKKGL